MIVSAVVFDVDGTLFDHVDSARAGLSQWLSELGVACSHEFVALWFEAEERHTATWRQGIITFAEQRRRRLREVLPLIDQPVGPDDELDEVFNGYLSAYQRAWRGYPDTDAALRAVVDAGLTTAVLTNGADVQQRAKLSHVGLLEAIGPVFTAEGLGVAKPDARAFTAVCRHLDLPPERVVYLGDEYEVDVVGARAAGLAAIHLDRTSTGPEDEAARITTLTDLLPLLTSCTTDP